MVKGIYDVKDREFEVIGVGIQDSKDNIEEFSRELKMTWPVVFDDGNVISKSYGITYGAGMVFVGADGKVKARFVNAVDSKELNRSLKLIIRQ